MDGSETQYFQVARTYIHLNPARAKLIRIGEQKLSSYVGSSYPGYLHGTEKRPAWLHCQRVLGSLGLPLAAAKDTKDTSKREFLSCFSFGLARNSVPSQIDIQ